MRENPAPDRISARLKNALVADLVAEADLEEADRLLLARMNDEHDWTEHLGRQLGISASQRRAGLHDTLILLIPELERLLREWPLPEQVRASSVLARHAVKSLDPVEVFATLLAGPSTWHKAPVAVDCKVENLASHLRGVLERALAAELNRLLTRWREWDIPRMRQAWEAAKTRRDEELLAERRAPAASPLRASKGRPGRRRSSSSLDAARRHQGFYQPPGRA